MNLPNTGVFDLNWSSVTGINGYKIDFFVNKTNLKKVFADSSATSFSYTGYREGDFAQANLYTYKTFNNHKIYSANAVQSFSKTFSPENFNTTSGESFYFTGIEVNNTSLDSTLYTGNIYEADASYELPDSPNDGIDFNFSDPKPRIIGLSTTSKVNSGQLYEVDRVRFTSSTGTIASIRINGTDNLNIAYRGVNWEMTSIAQSAGFFSTGSINDDTVNIKYNLISPRDKSLINNFQDFINEPFGKSVTGYIEDQSGYHVSIPNIFSTTVNFTYTGNNRNFNFHIVAEDYYTGLSTGIISLNNSFAKVEELPFATETINNSSGNLNFFPVYSKAITGIHAFLYNDSSYSSLDQTLITDDTSSFSFQIDLNSDKYLKLIPYERYGSGHHYNPQTNFGIYENVNEASNTAKINLKSFQTISGERFAKVYGNTNLQSYSGYHLDFSIYTGINNSTNQYFSGSFNNDVDYLFDVTGSRSGAEENFNVDFVLYKSGNSQYLDSGTMQMFVPYPKITRTSIIQNNSSDSPSFDFNWNTNIKNYTSYLNFLINYSGVNQYTTQDKTLNIPMSGVRQKSINVSLVNSSNSGEVYDTLSLTGISYIPRISEIQVINDEFYAPKFDQVVISPLISGDYFSGFKLYENKTFKIVDAQLTTGKESLDSWSINESFFNQESNENYINIPSPASVETQRQALSTGDMLGSGYYLTGNIYHYKIIPYDFVGSGEMFEFDLEHGLANFATVIRSDTDTTINNVTVISGNVGNVDASLVTVSGNVNTVSSNLGTVSGDLINTQSDLATISGRTKVLPTGNQIMSGNLNVTGNSHISGQLNVGRTEDNVLFAVHGTGSFINSNLEVSGRLAVSGRLTIGGDPPTSSTNTGIRGQIAFDENYFYVCTGRNRWGRIELSDW